MTTASQVEQMIAICNRAEGEGRSGPWGRLRKLITQVPTSADAKAGAETICKSAMTNGPKGPWGEVLAILGSVDVSPTPARPKEKVNTTSGPAIPAE